MFLFTFDYESSLKQHWETFIFNQNPIPEGFSGVRTEVLESWKRSLQYKVSPLDIHPPSLSQSEISHVLKENHALISISHSYIHNLYSFVKGTNFAIILTDKNGCVIETMSDDILINNQTEGTGLKIGAIRRESLTGTSGIGTCLYLNKPFQILGEEHFIEPHHKYICSAAPIHDSNGDILGCIAMLGPREVKSAHSLGMVSAAADGIGKYLEIDRMKDVRKVAAKMGGFTARYTFESILGCSSKIIHEKAMALNAARSSSNLLILGESGTGKELFAQSVHNASDRAQGPFVAINCAALPKALIESELFGYDPGAFTGANKKGHTGKFELAEGGTLFLDEIGDMTLELQASLLRALQNKEITRIGGKQTKKIDVRIIAATNVNLTESIKQKTFREDLYYRLNVLSIKLTPLRDRPEDIPLLIDHFMDMYGGFSGKKLQLSPKAKKLLEHYQWPGNIRELENIIERAANLTASHIITEAELSDEIRQNKTALPNRFAGKISDELIRNNTASICEYELILDVLKRTHGDVTSTSSILNIPSRTLYRKLKKYNINVSAFKVW